MCSGLCTYQHLFYILLKNINYLPDTVLGVRIVLIEVSAFNQLVRNVSGL